MKEEYKQIILQQIEIVKQAKKRIENSATDKADFIRHSDLITAANEICLLAGLLPSVEAEEIIVKQVEELSSYSHDIKEHMGISDIDKLRVILSASDVIRFSLSRLDE